jgi:adhesin transport system outer membrane protein
VIDWFKWWICSVLILILQFVLSPIGTMAAVEMQVGDAESNSSLDSSLSQKIDGFPQIDGGFTVPGKQNLEGLTGISEIPVLLDTYGEFVKNMAKNQTLAENFANQVGEASLFESIRAGRSFNRDSLAALARTEQAKAQTGQAFALLLPNATVRLSKGREKSKPSVETDETTGELISSSTHTRTDAALTIRQPLFDLPSFLDWRRRKVIEQARGENYRASDGDAYISTVNAYLSLVASRLQTDMTREFEAQLADLLSYIEKRASAGAASISDMARVRARSDETLSIILEQDSAHATAGIEFVRLTNLVPEKIRLPVLEDVGISLLPKSLDMAVATAMKSNPEIAALTAELQAAKIDQAAAKGRYWPRVDAEYTDTYALHAGGEPSSDGQRDRRLMMVMNWNLFSGGGDYKHHLERSARYKELQYLLDDQRRRVVQALLANYAALATTSERIVAGYQELKSISIASEAMSKRMLSGNQSLLDLLDVYDRFYQARARLVSLHILEMNTVAQLVRLTFGTPWPASDGTLPVTSDEILPGQPSIQNANANASNFSQASSTDERGSLNLVSHPETSSDLPQQAETIATSVAQVPDEKSASAELESSPVDKDIVRQLDSQHPPHESEYAAPVE